VSIAPNWVLETRRKNDRASHVELNVHIGEGRAVERVALADSPTVPVVVPVFAAKPGILSNATPTDETAYRLWVWQPDQNNKLQKERLAKVHKGVAHGISVDLTLPLNQFMRMLAKIAHAAATAMYRERIREPLLPPYVLGRDVRLPYVVGSWQDPGSLQASPDKPWIAEPGIFSRGDKRFLTVRIELFRWLYSDPSYRGHKCPPYWVVVCEADGVLADAVLKRADQKT
jgi:hypothetical protein